MVDRKEVAMNPAVELSYLKKNEQRMFLEAMDYSQTTPSLSQAQRLKKLSQEGTCTQDAMFRIMSEEKKDELDRLTIRSDVLRKKALYSDYYKLKNEQRDLLIYKANIERIMQLDEEEK